MEAARELPISGRIALAAVPSIITAAGMARFHNGWAIILAYHAAIVAGLAFFGKGRLEPLSSWSWSRLATASCVASVLVFPGLVTLFPAALHGPLPPLLSHMGLSGSAWALFVPYFAVVNPVLEELFWRGLLRGAKRGMIFDALFAAYHLPVLACFMIFPFVCIAGAALFCAAWMWRILSNQSGSVAPAIVAHSIGDIAILSAICLHR